MLSHTVTVHLPHSFLITYSSPLPAVEPAAAGTAHLELEMLWEEVKPGIRSLCAMGKFSL